MRNLVLLLLGFLALSQTSCKEKNQEGTSLISENALTFKKEGVLHLFKADGTKVKTIDIEIADTDFERDTDLKNRAPLGRDQGFLFVYPQIDLVGFYMTDIAFSLDLIFLNGDNRIVSFSENTEPFNDTTFLPSQVPALSVLKIKGGLAEEWVLEVGDYVKWTVFEN